MTNVQSYKDQGIGVVVLNRPERRNALTAAMDVEIHRAATSFDRDDTVVAVLITGAGNSFCAGGDFDRLKEIAAAGAAAYSPESHFRYFYLTRLSKPVIAALNGPAVGSGLALALHCDMRIAATTASFGAPFANLGLIAELGIPWHLSRLIGSGRTMEFLLSRRAMTADEAMATGLVSAIVDCTDFRQEAVRHVAKTLHAADAHALRVIKQQIWDAASQTLPEALIAGGIETADAIARSEFKTRLLQRAKRSLQ